MDLINQHFLNIIDTELELKFASIENQLEEDLNRICCNVTNCSKVTLSQAPFIYSHIGSINVFGGLGQA